MPSLNQIYEYKPQKGKCPICAHEQAERLWQVNSKQAAQHFIAFEQQPQIFATLAAHIEHLWGQSTCDILRCASCDFCYSYPYIAGDAYFYNLAYPKHGYPSWKWEFDVTYAALQQRQLPNLQLLEVGAGDGAFVRKVAADITAKTNIVCTEYSDTGKLAITQMGIQCFATDVRSLTDASMGQRFDAVCLFQVLEHLDNLPALFSQFRWLLRTDGDLFIAVPNPAGIAFNELNGGLLDMPPNHIGRWNKQCFEVVGKKYGFALIDHQVEQGRFVPMAKQFIIYRFLRRAQTKSHWENRIWRIKNPYLFRLVRLFAVSVNTIAAIPTLVQLNASLGNAQWVHFRKR